MIERIVLTFIFYEMKCLQLLNGKNFSEISTVNYYVLLIVYEMYQGGYNEDYALEEGYC